jgi:hypothetical protein
MVCLVAFYYHFKSCLHSLVITIIFKQTRLFAIRFVGAHGVFFVGFAKMAKSPKSVVCKSQRLQFIEKFNGSLWIHVDTLELMDDSQPCLSIQRQLMSIYQ